MSYPEQAAEVLALCARIAAHTDVPGTITRLFLSPATHRVHALLRAELESLGLDVRIDAIGNLRALYPGPTPDAPVLLLGSHIDTVPDAGPYDGILGVALPLVLLKSLAGTPLPYAIELIAFSEEEGVRFKFPFLGSRALINDLTPTDLARTDAAGISVSEALESLGAPSRSVPSNEVGSQTPDLSNALLLPNTFAFLELHIEQGPLLDSLDLPLGIVTSIVGQSRFDLTFTGQANHAGTTPMHLRRDPLAAAAVWMHRTEAYALAAAPLVATVGIIATHPGAANVIPATCTLSLDIRHPDPEALAQATAHVLSLATDIASTRGLRFEAHPTTHHPATPMHPGLRALLAEAAGQAAHHLPSGAGHDAMILARAIPAAMLFVRSPGGISHHPAETVHPADIAAALETCTRFLTTLNPADIAK
jgi:allantoate deiminase